MSDSPEGHPSSQLPDTLAGVRDRIDLIDQQLLDLISQRARLAEVVAEIKTRDGGQSEQGHFYRPEREAQILRGIRAANPGPLKDEAITWLFREIMSACLAHEKPLTIATLGPSGTFSELAAIRAFGHGANLSFEPEIQDVFRAVHNAAADFGVVPLENSTEGSVTRTLDCLSQSTLTICGELDLPVDQQLLAHPDAPQTPKTIVGHAQSLAQCRQWLDHHYPQVERLTVASNAAGAIMASEQPDVMALGAELAASRYGLKIVARNIQDDVRNTTRFAVLGRDPVPPSGADKTSLLVSVNNQPGALARLLAPLADNGIDVSRIESRPARDRVWDYVFFIDFTGHQQDPAVRAALDALAPHCGHLRVLGSYPQPVLGRTAG